jgi:hypothetical protein
MHEDINAVRFDVNLVLPASADFRGLGREPVSRNLANGESTRGVGFRVPSTWRSHQRRGEGKSGTRTCRAGPACVIAVQLSVSCLSLTSLVP